DAAPSCSTVLSNHTALSQTHPLSLHDALPISQRLTADGPFPVRENPCRIPPEGIPWESVRGIFHLRWVPGIPQPSGKDHGNRVRSEEHTSELQSRFDLVCRLLLEKSKAPTARD